MFFKKYQKRKNKLVMDSAKGQFSDDVAGIVEENSNGQKPETSCFRYFQFEDLKTATSNFEPGALLGEGGFGKVYKGWIDQETLAPSESGTGMAVAIKLWNPETIQAFEQWQSEVNILGRRYHPNLIELFGYCWEDEMLVLVYEFMEKGSLKNHLFPSKSDSIEPLSWDIRLKIAIGGARGLAFLHTLDKQIIYRDFKPSAILLDANYNPKLSDLGLAKLGPSGDKTHVTTRMMGTYGYVAPEYVESGHLSVKSDVYSFGVVLLELLTGLRAVDLSWIKPMLHQKWKLNTIMDAQMEGQYPFEAAWQATQLTLKCLEINHKDRPSMKEVLDTLVQIEAITPMEAIPEVYEHVEALTSTEEVPKMLELVETLTTMKKVPKVLKHVEVMNEEPKNSTFGSRPSTDPSHGQPRIHHRFLTSLKASFQCVSSKRNCIRFRGAA